MLDIAVQLLAYEADASANSANSPPSALLVFDLLRQSLITLVGVHGFQVLLTRALVIAKTKVPGLSVVTVKPDGVLAGFNNLAQDQMAPSAVALINELLTLLTTFIGKDLVLSILMGVWPNLIVLHTGDSGEIENYGKQ